MWIPHQLKDGVKLIVDRNMSTRKRKINVAGYLFILPAFLFFLFFILYPILFVGWGSFFDWSTLSSMKFVGLENYKELFQDKVFWITLRNSVYWIVVTVPVQAILGFILAYIIEERLKRFKGFFRTGFFFPVVTSVVVIAIVWTKMYAPYQGIISHFLAGIGIQGQADFLGSPKTSIFAIILVNIWEWTGWSMVMYIAGISQIPEEIKEAAQIDGASGIKTIWYIYLPSLSSVHKSLLMLGIIGSLQTFALIFTMTAGGPNHASEMPGTYIFKTGFTNQQMGYASAISIFILLFALVLTVIQVCALGSGNFVGRGGKKNAE